MTAAEALGRALLELAQQGRATPCQGRRRDRWTSDSAEDRSWAATVCVTLACPVLEQCAALADERDERHHVWGGRDRTPPPASRRYSVVTTRPQRGQLGAIRTEMVPRASRASRENRSSRPTTPGDDAADGGAVAVAVTTGSIPFLGSDAKNHPGCPNILYDPPGVVDRPPTTHHRKEDPQ